MAVISPTQEATWQWHYGDRQMRKPEAHQTKDASSHQGNSTAEPQAKGDLLASSLRDVYNGVQQVPANTSAAPTTATPSPFLSCALTAAQTLDDSIASWYQSAAPSPPSSPASPVVGLEALRQSESKRSCTTTPSRTPRLESYPWSGSLSEGMEATLQNKDTNNTLSSKGDIGGSHKTAVRKEKNRVAARKCRARKVEHRLRLQRDFQELERTNVAYRARLQRCGNLYAREARMCEGLKQLLRATWSGQQAVPGCDELTADDAIARLETGALRLEGPQPGWGADAKLEPPFAGMTAAQLAFKESTGPGGGEGHKGGSGYGAFANGDAMVSEISPSSHCSESDWYLQEPFPTSDAMTGPACVTTGVNYLFPNPDREFGL